MLDGRTRQAVGEQPFGLALPLKLDQSPDLETTSRLEESCEIILWAAHFSAVHVHKQQLHVLEVDILQDNDGVLARVPVM